MKFGGNVTGHSDFFSVLSGFSWCFRYTDSDRDIKAAEAAGIKGFLFDGTNLKDFVYQKLAGLGYRDNGKEDI